jgi:RNA-directed DNA polymerase
VVDADIEGAFDNIDHGALLTMIGPVPGRELIRQWLKAGYLDNFVWHPTDAGTPQGGVISPLLANIALTGMEKALGVRTYASGQLLMNSKRAVVRYADDFVVFCESKEDAEATLGELNGWLALRGLCLSEDKTRICHLTDGFDFLGFTVRHYRDITRPTGYKVLIKPSKDSVKKIRSRLRDEWRSLPGQNAEAVIQRLNPIIRGWASYFRHGASSKTFSALDHWMFKRQVRYVNRSHCKKSKAWKKARYWGRLNPHRKDNWVFGNKRTRHYLEKSDWTRIIPRHILVQGTSSPDDAQLDWYWRKREKTKVRSLTPLQRRLAYSQRFECETCGDHLLNGEELHVHHVIPRRSPGATAESNLRLVHLYCHQQIHSRRTVP